MTYKFERNGVKYESRWHEKTPNSPSYMGKSWQVEKIVKGQGHGSNPRQKEKCHLLKGNNGTKKWISPDKYQECIKAKNNDTLTKKQKEVPIVYTGKINKKYYEGYEEYDYVAFKIKEQQDTALVLWDGYIDSILENQKEWNSGLSQDWCEETGPYESKGEDVEVATESYLNDLKGLDINLFSERLFPKKDVLEAYNSIIEFVQYVKDNNLTLLVNIGVGY